MCCSVAVHSSINTQPGGYEVRTCVAVCCSVLQCVAVWLHLWMRILLTIRYVRALQCVAVCRSVLQCVAVCHGRPRICSA